MIAPPALLVKENGQRIREATDQEIWADLDSHQRAMMRPLLKTPEFCAACHKAAVVPELNHRKWLRSFAIYDEWQQSAFSTETVQPLARRERQSCQSCHMPPMNGIASHRWPAANTAIPDHYGWPEQTAATTDLLKSGILTVDIFPKTGDQRSAVSSQQFKTQNSKLKTQNSKLKTPENSQLSTLEVDVVVANRGVGHSFPAELRDIFEAWLEFQATDAGGRVLMHSGAIREDGKLDEDAHAYRTVPIGDDGQPITRHDIWNTRVGAFDRSIPPGRADLGRFQVDVPKDVVLPITFTAKVNYRRFNRNFTDWVTRENAVKPAPVVEMVQTSTAFDPQLKTNNSKLKTPQWRAYGVALFDQQQYESAVQTFERALELTDGLRTPDSGLRTGLYIDLAMTCLRMERAGSSQTTLEQAEQAISHALAIDARYPRARFYRALLNVKRFRYTEALTDLEALSREYPRDRQVWTQLGSLYLLQYRDKEAQAAYEQVLKIDPDDTDAHLKIAGLYWRFGLFDRARQEQSRYTSYHTDTFGETLRRNYLREHPELFATWPCREFGGNPIGSMP